MCGICGIAGPSPDRVLLDEMLERLEHRGPDAAGRYLGGSCLLGHRRLSIVDLSEAGNQPMQTFDGQLWMIANGEIYNHLELRRELEELGHRFGSMSDCEVLLHGWRQWREALFPRINGMFAVAIWDEEEQELILGRDRMGIKPLYLYQYGVELRFASEIKALVGRNRDWRIDPQGLAQFLAMQNTSGATTLFDGISMLEPGELLRFRSGKLVRSRFWEPEFRPQTIGFEEAAQAFGQTSEAAVGRHLMADVEASTYLSAGFDSGGVSALAARQSRSTITSITGAFDAGGWYDEATGAAEIARHAGIEHRIERITAKDFATHFDDLIWALDEPRMGMGAFAQFMTARAIASTHKFVLTGHGGDELFSGYPVFKVAQAASSVSEMLRMLPAIRPSELPHFAYFWPHPWQSSQKRLGVPQLFSQRHLRGLLHPHAMRSIAETDPVGGLKAASASGTNAYERLLLSYLRVYLPGLLVVEDKISMAHSLESRTPLLDNALVDLALSIPAEVKLHQGTLKAIPKKAFRPLLPESLYRLPKRGFPTPLAGWLRGPLRGWFENRLNPDRSLLTSLLDGTALRRETASFLDALSRHWRPLDEIKAHRMWMLICLDGWLRCHQERLGVELKL